MDYQTEEKSCRKGILSVEYMYGHSGAVVYTQQKILA